MKDKVVMPSNKTVLLSLEYSDDKKGIYFPKEKKEIIAIGAKIINSNNTFVSEFYSLVKPNNELSQYCLNKYKGLSEYPNDLFNDALKFNKVYFQLEDWISSNAGEDYTLAIWGKYDLEMFNKHCKSYNLINELSYKIDNLKLSFAIKNKIKKEGGVPIKTAIKLAGMTYMKGKSKKAKDSVDNISRLLPYIYGEYRIKRQKKINYKKTNFNNEKFKGTGSY